MSVPSCVQSLISCRPRWLPMVPLLLAAASASAEERSTFQDPEPPASVTSEQRLEVACYVTGPAGRPRTTWFVRDRRGATIPASIFALRVGDQDTADLAVTRGRRTRGVGIGLVAGGGALMVGALASERTEYGMLDAGAYAASVGGGLAITGGLLALVASSGAENITRYYDQAEVTDLVERYNAELGEPASSLPGGVPSVRLEVRPWVSPVGAGLAGTF